MAKIIRKEDRKPDPAYDPPLICAWGINDEVVGQKTRHTILHAVWPPGKRNAVHLHKNADNGMYIIRGRVQVVVGEDRKVYEAKAGDFIYVPVGEIHMVQNASDTEEVELVGVYGGISNAEREAGNVWIDRPND